MPKCVEQLGKQMWHYDQYKASFWITIWSDTNVDISCSRNPAHLAKMVRNYKETWGNDV